MSDQSLGTVFLNACLINNFVLAYFLGICPFLGVSNKLATAVRMGGAGTNRREVALFPLLDALQAVAANLVVCSTCGNVETSDPCAICRDPRSRSDASSAARRSRVVIRRSSAAAALWRAATLVMVATSSRMVAMSSSSTRRLEAMGGSRKMKRLRAEGPQRLKGNWA